MLNQLRLKSKLRPPRYASVTSTFLTVNLSPTPPSCTLCGPTQDAWNLEKVLKSVVRPRIPVLSAIHDKMLILLLLIVMFQPMKEEPPLNAKCKDKFLIQSTLLTPEKESKMDIVRYLQLSMLYHAHNVRSGQFLKELPMTQRSSNRNSRLYTCLLRARPWKKRTRRMTT